MPVRIDSHQHFWRYDAREYDWIDDSMQRLRRDFLPADLRPLLDAAGIDACIAVQARQSLDETRFLLELAQQAPWVQGVVGWIDLQAEDVTDQLREFTGQPALVGIRHIAQAEPDPRFLVGERFLRGIAALQDFDLTYDILVFAPQLPAAVELVARFPNQRFVLDHLGKPDLRAGALDDWSRQIDALASHPNVACKVSGLATEADWQRWTPATLAPALETVGAAFGCDRLLYGSDWPVCLCAVEYPRWHALVADWLAGRTAAERDAVFGGNATRWYPLPGRST